jgi:hypothetical protein
MEVALAAADVGSRTDRPAPLGEWEQSGDSVEPWNGTTGTPLAGSTYEFHGPDRKEPVDAVSPLAEAGFPAELDLETAAVPGGGSVPPAIPVNSGPARVTARLERVAEDETAGGGEADPVKAEDSSALPKTVRPSPDPVAPKPTPPLAPLQRLAAAFREASIADRAKTDIDLAAELFQGVGLSRETTRKYLGRVRREYLRELFLQLAPGEQSLSDHETAMLLYGRVGLSESIATRWVAELRADLVPATRKPEA